MLIILLNLFVCLEVNVKINTYILNADIYMKE